MTALNVLEILIFIVLVISITPLLGKFMADLFQGNKTFLHPLLGGLENLCYRVSGVEYKMEMSWRTYAKTLLLFNFFGFIFLFLLLLVQYYLPLNPQQFPGLSWRLSFNIAASFVTNTNWQSYTPESTLSYFSQMLGLTVQNFLSAATGNAALLALIRGISRKTVDTIGNFWEDLVRTIVYILLPLSMIFAVFLISQGVIQTFSPYIEVTTLENGKQTIPLGPAASQIAIKQIGTNGGGFFNANSAHPFENPTPLSNFLEALAIIVIPAASVSMYGRMIGNKKHGWLIFVIMFIIWIIGMQVSLFSELLVNPIMQEYPNLEGKETRLGITNSLLWSVTTTTTANGSVNAMIESFSPLAGGVALFNIMVGEIVFGGIGVGLSGMLMIVLLTVFLSGLMVGRTPEYQGKKLELREMQWIMLAVLTQGSLILIGSAISCVLPDALSSLTNHGPHGLTSILYAFTSCAGNNGSAFAGLNANTDYYNVVLGIVMIIARIAVIIPPIAIGGLLAAKKINPPSLGTFSTDSFLFSALLMGVIVIVGALTYFPALTLGPIVEHLLMLQGRSF